MWRRAFLQGALVVSLVSYAWAQGCNSSQKLCPNSACVDIKSVCPTVTCHTVPARCHDGTCVPKQRVCRQKCRSGLKPCPDGSCQLVSSDCSGVKKDNCPKRCKDGRCILPTAYCAEELCPYWKQNRCLDGDCFSDGERCDGVADCQDNTDENGCENGPTDVLAAMAKWPWWVYAIGVGLFVLLCLIIALCCRYQNKQSRARQMRRAARMRRQQQANQPYRHEMPAVAGRRTHPVPTGGGRAGASSLGGPTPQPVAPRSATPRAYQAVPTQPPAANPPYNPSFSQSHSPYGQLGGGPQHTPEGLGNVQPSAPPLGMEAPPPYSEAVSDPFPPLQTGAQNPPYLPSYETVQRSAR